jgi:hypothetical protein
LDCLTIPSISSAERPVSHLARYSYFFSRDTGFKFWDLYPFSSSPNALFISTLSIPYFNPPFPFSSCVIVKKTVCLVHNSLSQIRFHRVVQRDRKLGIKFVSLFLPCFQFLPDFSLPDFAVDIFFPSAKLHTKNRCQFDFPAASKRTWLFSRSFGREEGIPFPLFIEKVRLPEFFS